MDKYDAVHIVFNTAVGEDGIKEMDVFFVDEQECITKEEILLVIGAETRRKYVFPLNSIGYFYKYDSSNQTVGDAENLSLK